MKTPRLLASIVVALPLWVFFSCSRGEESPGPETIHRTGEKITFSINFSETRAITDEEFKTRFITGDASGVFAVKHSPGTEAPLEATGNFLHNVRFTYVDNHWESDAEVYFPTDGDVLDFYAYYPYIDDPELDPKNLAFTVLANQNDMESGSSTFNLCDLMWGVKKDVEPQRVAVFITYEHLFSMVQVRAIPETGMKLDEDFAVVIKDVRTTAALDMSSATGDLTTDEGQTGDVEMYRVETSDPGVNLYRALLPPQTLPEGQVFEFVQRGEKPKDPVLYKTEARDILLQNKVSKYAITLYGVFGEALHHYKVGDYYPDPEADVNDPVQKSKIQGVVFWIDERLSEDGGISSPAGKMVSLYENAEKKGAMKGLAYGPYQAGGVGTTSKTDGRLNYNILMSYISSGKGDLNQFSAFHWIFTDLNGRDQKGKWFLPAINELQHLYCGLNGYKPVEWVIGTEDGKTPPRDEETAVAREEFNRKLTEAGGEPLTHDYYDESGDPSWPFYWSSTEWWNDYALSIHMTTGYTTVDEKDYKLRVRPIALFR